jgi:hypothetical protein
MAAVTKELAKVVAALISGLATAIGEWLGGELYESLTKKGKKK